MDPPSDKVLSAIIKSVATLLSAGIACYVTLKVVTLLDPNHERKKEAKKRMEELGAGQFTAAQFTAAQFTAPSLPPPNLPRAQFTASPIYRRPIYRSPIYREPSLPHAHFTAFLQNNISNK